MSVDRSRAPGRRRCRPRRRRTTAGRSPACRAAGSGTLGNLGADVAAQDPVDGDRGGRPPVTATQHPRPARTVSPEQHLEHGVVVPVADQPVSERGGLASRAPAPRHAGGRTCPAAVLDGDQRPSREHVRVMPAEPDPGCRARAARAGPRSRSPGRAAVCPSSRQPPATRSVGHTRSRRRRRIRQAPARKRQPRYGEPSSRTSRVGEAGRRPAELRDEVGRAVPLDHAVDVGAPGVGDERPGRDRRT